MFNTFNWHETDTIIWSSKYLLINFCVIRYLINCYSSCPVFSPSHFGHVYKSWWSWCHFILVLFYFPGACVLQGTSELCPSHCIPRGFRHEGALLSKTGSPSQGWLPSLVVMAGLRPVSTLLFPLLWLCRDRRQGHWCCWERFFIRGGWIRWAAGSAHLR